MNLAPYVDELREQLLVIAEAGGDDVVRRLAEQLTAALDASVRLVLLDALAAAAAEITHDLAPGSVEVRLRGRDPEFVVSVDHLDDPVSIGPAPAPANVPGLGTGGFDDDGGTARITLRVAEHVKAQIDTAAARDGISVNGWLVRSVAAALATGGQPRPAASPVSPRGQRYTGWAR
jgi:hypothetical protein